jgi:hypothetical protein
MKYILLFLTGCSGWGFGVIGSEQEHNQNHQLIDNHCVEDHNCKDGYICVKNYNNYVGICGRIINE